MAIFALLILGAFGGLDPCNEANEAQDLTADPFDPSSNSYDWINTDPGLPPLSNCADGADNEGDGTGDQTDYDCFQLHDADGNGVCDTRVFGMGLMESSSNQFFQTFISCSGFEGCISDDIRATYAASQGWVKSI